MMAKRKISRRKFILLLLISVVAVMTTYFFITPFNKVVVKILGDDLDHLNIDKAYFSKFASDAAQSNHWNKKFFNKTKQMFVRAFYIVDYSFLPLPYKYKYKQYRSEIVGDFLLSTDFFLNKMDTDKEVTYIGLYNPYKRPCSNPFSNLYYQEA